MSTGKSIYYEARKELGWSREKAAEELCFINYDRLERIETGKLDITPEEVLRLSEVYGKPELWNHYCTSECPIGQKYAHKVMTDDLSSIVLKVAVSLDDVYDSKKRLMKIAEDDKITEDEEAEFNKIKEQLDHIITAIESLKLCAEKLEKKK